VSGVIQGFTVIFIVIAVGFVLGRTDLLGPGATMVLSRLVFFVCTPALLFSSLAKADIADVFSTTLVVAGGSALIVGALYFTIARLLLRRAVPEATIGALSSSYVNSANLGIPIAIFVLDDASFVAPLLLFQIMVYSPLALTTLDLTALDRLDEDGNQRRISLRDTIIAPLTNPIVLGGVAGLAIAVSGITPPQALMQPFDMLGNASVPGALLVFGLSLTGVAVLRKGESPRRDVALATVLKMVVQPVIVYFMARFAFGAEGHELFALVVIAALPTAQSVLVYATRYQRGVVLARDSALVTTLLAVPGIALIALLLA
jgi:malonate transporter and related proteins